MTQLIFGHDEELTKWAEERLDMPLPFARPCHAIGIASNDGKKLYAVVIYNGFSYYACEATIVAATPRWATPNNIRAIMHYPFVQLGVKRMTAITAKANKRARKLLEGVGFKLEGVHPYAYDGVKASCSYGIYSETVFKKWLKNG